MRQRHRRIVAALALSLLLHAVIAWLLLFRVEPAPPQLALPPSSSVVQLDIVHTPPPAPNAEPKTSPVKPPPPPPRHPQGKAPTQQRAGSPPAAPPGKPNGQARPSDAPLATAPQPSLHLSPSTLPNGIAVPPSSEEGTHGHTLRPGDPSLSPEAKRAEEEARVNERAQQFAWDGIAESRAQPGIAHPYLGDVGQAISDGLDHADGGTLDALGAPSNGQFMAQRYEEARSEYARTGNPGIETPGPNPRQSEILKQQYGSEGQWVQALAQATETQEDLKHGAPLLTLTVEVRLGAHGEFRSARIITRSKSARFDAFVMRELPAALGRMPPPPDEVLHGRDELRSVWRIDGWRKTTQAEVMGLDSIGAEGIPLPKHQSNDFDFRAHLLKAYY